MLQPERANLEVHYQKLIAGFIGSRAAGVWYDAHRPIVNDATKTKRSEEGEKCPVSEDSVLFSWMDKD